MKSIKDRSKNTKTQENTNNQTNVIEELSGKSESELMSELLSVAAKKRQEGSLNNEDLENFRSQISSSLSKEQNERLDQIISMLKR